METEAFNIFNSIDIGMQVLILLVSGFIAVKHLHSRIKLNEESMESQKTSVQTLKEASTTMQKDISNLGNKVDRIEDSIEVIQADIKRILQIFIDRE